MSKSFNTATYQGNIAAPINLSSVTCRNEGASQLWLMLFDSSTTPVNGQTPNIGIPVAVPAGLPASWDFVPIRPIVNGLYWMVSSTEPTLTIATGATFNVDVGF